MTDELSLNTFTTDQPETTNIAFTSLDSNHYLEPSASSPHSGDDNPLPVKQPTAKVPTPGVTTPGLPPPRLQTPPQTAQFPVDFSNGRSPSPSAPAWPQAGGRGKGVGGEGPMTVKKGGESATRGHDYEELPSNRYKTAPGQSMSHHSGESTDFLCDSPRRPQLQPQYRRRENPVYLSTYDESVKGKPRSAAVCSKTSWVLAAVSLLAIAAFALTILLATGILRPSGSTAAELALLRATVARLQEVESNYSQLVRKYGDLELTLINLYNENGELSTRLAATVRQVDSLLDSAADVQGTVAQLSDKYNATGELVAGLQQSLAGGQTELANLSSSAARRDVRLNELTTQLASHSVLIGSHGVALSALSNLSTQSESQYEAVARLPASLTDLQTTVSRQAAEVTAMRADWRTQLTSLDSRLTARLDVVANHSDLAGCTHKKFTSGSQGNIASTTWLPQTEADNDMTVITGMACTSDSGTVNSRLVTRQQTSWRPGVQYRCVCVASPPSPYFYCILHFWVCPRLHT